MHLFDKEHELPRRLRHRRRPHPDRPPGSRSRRSTASEDRVTLCFFGEGAVEQRRLPRGPRAGGAVEAARSSTLREQPVRDGHRRSSAPAPSRTSHARARPTACAHWIRRRRRDRGRSAASPKAVERAPPGEPTLVEVRHLPVPRPLDERSRPVRTTARRTRSSGSGSAIRSRRSRPASRRTGWRPRMELRAIGREISAEIKSAMEDAMESPEPSHRHGLRLRLPRNDPVAGARRPLDGSGSGRWSGETSRSTRVTPRRAPSRSRARGGHDDHGDISYPRGPEPGDGEEMERDPNVFLMGEEVGVLQRRLQGHQGHARSGSASKRVIDTPIAESGFAGVGIGAAMVGLRPIIEFMTFNFSLAGDRPDRQQRGEDLPHVGGQFNVPDRVPRPERRGAHARRAAPPVARDVLRARARASRS